MVGRLITLPVRLSARTAGTMLRVGVSASGRALDLAGELLRAFGRDADGHTPPPPAAATAGRDEVVTPQREQPTSPAVKVGSSQATPSRPPEQDEPSHVSEESVVVEELAETGAEEGAGANVEVAEPWDAYDRMTAKEVIGRVRECTAAELAVVELYEQAHRQRRTVLAAVERELQSKNGGARTS